MIMDLAVNFRYYRRVACEQSIPGYPFWVKRFRVVSPFALVEDSCFCASHFHIMALAIFQ